MTKQEIFDELVDPVCALEEYCNTGDASAIVCIISKALLDILHDIEDDCRKEKS